MDVVEISDGLWRWTAPHPAWTTSDDSPSGWPRDVGCVSWEPGDRGGLVLVDPLAPAIESPEDARFWRALDRDVERAGPVTIVVTNAWHGRSAQRVRDRYGVEPGAGIWCHEAAEPAAGTFRPDRRLQGEEGELPGGVRWWHVEPCAPGELALHVPAARALVFGDAVIGAGEGRARICPASWAPRTPEGQALHANSLRPRLRQLLALDVEILLPSHGEPVLSDGRAALEAALAAPEWGSG